MSKFSLLALTLALASGVLLFTEAKAQTQGYGGAGGSTDAWGGAPGMGTGSRKKPAASDANGDSSDPDDPSLTRLRTKDSLASGAMSRDDGELTAKLRKREKVSNVESTKQLPTSKTDSKFQGSLLQSSVGSISDVREKAHLNLQNVELQAKAEDTEKENADPPVKEENEARFKARQLMFNASPDEHSKNTEPPRAKAASSSPSPSPSASASPSSR